MRTHQRGYKNFGKHRKWMETNENSESFKVAARFQSFLHLLST